jgi:tRNA-uridine 2-sulfurtransferase
MKQKIVVAMSGGVDSSVVAAMLTAEGHEVIGITIKTYRYEDIGGKTGNENTCCSLDGINDARTVAAQFGFPHYVLDFSERFGFEVIDTFVQEYVDGRTPNPCVICNRKIKWEELIRKAEALGAGSIATGHYARIDRNPGNGRLFVARGKDREKDQSYALWGLTQESLERTLFPLSGMTKPEVRALGERLGVPFTDKPESYEICFIPDNDYARFLKDRRPGLGNSVDGGEIVLDGKVVGRHQGYPFYTIGQRRGLGVYRAEPLYVTGIDPAANRIEIGTEAKLYRTGLIARSVNLQKYPALPVSMPVVGCIRYKDEGGAASAVLTEDGRLQVTFSEPRRAITPGQSVVLYEGGGIVGGGVIEQALD